MKLKKADVNYHKENKNLSQYSIHKMLLATSRNEMAKKSIVENEKQLSKQKHDVRAQLTHGPQPADVRKF